ncbi:MAG: hypothetical protein MJ175_09075 [Clostridia bacterium]|nr:hypothetical protein [Clostridia bacterium]
MNDHSSSGRIYTVPKSLAGNHDLAGVYKFLAVLCYGLLTVHFPCILLLTLYENPGFIQVQLLVYFALCLAAGYGIQAATGKLFRIRRPKAGNGYEDMKHRYKAWQAIPAHLAALAWTGVAVRIGFAIMHRYADIYTRSAVEPVLLAVGSIALIEYGAYLWFIPHNVLVSQRSTTIVIMMIVFQTLEILYAGGYSIGIYAATMPAFEVTALLLYMALMNQELLTREYDNRVSHVNDAAKLFSAIVIFGGAAGIVALMFLVRSVVLFLFRLVRFLFAYSIVHAGGAHPGRPIELPGGANGLIEVLFPGAGKGIRWLFVFLCIFVCAIFVILVIPVFRDKAKQWGKRFRTALVLLWSRRYRKDSGVMAPAGHFTDTVENILPSWRRRTRKLPTRSEYEKHFAALASPGEQYAYAYAVYARCMEERVFAVRPSDTPRERAGKTAEDSYFPNAHIYAVEYENLHYGDLQESQESSLAALHNYLLSTL